MNPKTPPGGFKQGAWYDGRQYWGGTFSEPGQINPLSNQQGAGQQVSPQVIAQTNPANVAFIEQQRKEAAAAPAAPTAGVSPTGTPTGATGVSGATGAIAPQPTIDLQSIYNNLYNSPEMKARQDKVTQAQAVLSQREKEKIEAVGAINDNPFLSEATRVGKVAKIEQLFNERTANLRKDIEMAASEMTTGKADAEMQLNLQLKQFDINSQAARDALSQFNSLLSSGALDGASGDDIANITRGTGISSSMIQSAINANREKNVKTSTISYDDGTNQGFAIINERTGEIINKQVIAASKPKVATKATEAEISKSLRGKASQILEANKNSYGNISPAKWQQILAAYTQDGGTRDEFIKNFGQYTDPNRDDFKSAYGFNKDRR